MTGVLTHVEGATLPRPARPASINQAKPLAVRGPFIQAAVVAGDLLGLVAIVLCIPFVILAVGTPIVLGVRLLMWLAALL